MGRSFPAPFASRRGQFSSHGNAHFCLVFREFCTQAGFSLGCHCCPSRRRAPCAFQGSPPTQPVLRPRNAMQNRKAELQPSQGKHRVIGCPPTFGWIQLLQCALACLAKLAISERVAVHVALQPLPVVAHRGSQRRSLSACRGRRR